MAYDPFTLPGTGNVNWTGNGLGMMGLYIMTSIVTLQWEWEQDRRPMVCILICPFPVPVLIPIPYEPLFTPTLGRHPPPLPRADRRTGNWTGTIENMGPCLCLRPSVNISASHVRIHLSRSYSRTMWIYPGFQIVGEVKQVGIFIKK